MTPQIIRKGMQVLDHRGTLHGTVGEMGDERFCVTKRGVDGLEEHWLHISKVEWVDHAVHLFQNGNEVGVGATVASAAGKPPPRHPAEFGDKKRWRLPLPWFVALAVLALAGLVTLNSMRDRARAASQGAATGLALPGGRTIAVAQGSLEDDLQHYLASAQPAPRMFTLKAITFSDGDAALPAGADAVVKPLARIVAAYPRVRVQVVGYADVPKSVRVAVDVQTAADLGRRRAAALAAALVAAGVPTSAIDQASGSDPDYIDGITPATTKDAGDRHPDVIVIRK